MRRAAATGLVLAALATTALAAPRDVVPRQHRLTLPPPIPAAMPEPPPPPAEPPPLPSSFSVSEYEFRLSVSRAVVAAGEVAILVYNRGEDDHDLAVTGADGVVQKVDVPPRDSRSMSARLAPGRAKVWCTLPGHEELGMSAYVEVR